MNPYARPNAYRENSIRPRPRWLVVMLYDGAGRSAPGRRIDARRLLAAGERRSSAAPRPSSTSCSPPWTWTPARSPTVCSPSTSSARRASSRRASRATRPGRPGRPTAQRAARGVVTGPLPGRRVSAWEALEALAAEGPARRRRTFDDLAELSSARGVRADSPARRPRRCGLARCSKSSRACLSVTRHTGPLRCPGHRARPAEPWTNGRAGLRAHVRSPTLSTAALKARAEPPMT
jgi:hypothetical protein